MKRRKCPECGRKVVRVDEVKTTLVKYELGEDGEPKKVSSDAFAESRFFSWCKCGHTWRLKANSPANGFYPNRD